MKSSCPLYNNSNLDSTGDAMNNPYALIQRAGKTRRKKSKRHKSYKCTNIRNTKKSKKNKRVRFNLNI